MTHDNEEDSVADYVEFDECYQDGRRMRRRSRRIDLATKNPVFGLADLLVVMRLAEVAKPRGRLTAAELVARIVAVLLEAPAGSMRLADYRVPLSGSRGLGERDWFGSLAEATADGDSDSRGGAQGHESRGGTDA